MPVKLMEVFPLTLVSCASGVNYINYLFSVNEGNNIFFMKHSLLDSQCSAEQCLNCMFLFQDFYFTVQRPKIL